jgi:twitching motility protein PilJ
MLLERQVQLRALASARGALADGGRPLQSPLRALMVARLRAGVGTPEIAQATELVMTTQNVASNLVVWSQGSMDLGLPAAIRTDMARVTALLQELSTGDAARRLPPVVDAEGKRALAEISALWSAAQAPLAAALTDPEQLAQARRAGAALVAQIEPLNRALTGFEDPSREGHPSGRPPWLVMASFALALVCMVALARVWLVDNRRRTREAEQQRRVAQRLEQQAKRANEQNQAAILRLMNELQEVADGDLTVQATVSEDITGAIADSVNYTIEELRNLVSRINATAEQVNEASVKAQMTASSLQAASDQQSREIRGTGEAVLRLAQQINEVSARASESVDVARTSLVASQAGAGAVNNAIAGMNGIRDQIQETAKRIKRLGESSQQIGEIVEKVAATIRAAA